MSRSQTLVFLGIDVPLSLTRRPAGLVQLEFTAYALYQAQLVVAVQNLKILWQPRLPPVSLQ